MAIRNTKPNDQTKRRADEEAHPHGEAETPDRADRPVSGACA